MALVHGTRQRGEAHGGHVPCTRHPVRTLLEQVACDRVTEVGGDFGLVTG
jgi:hypothetical protein